MNFGQTCAKCVKKEIINCVCYKVSIWSQDVIVQALTFTYSQGSALAWYHCVIDQSSTYNMSQYAREPTAENRKSSRGVPAGWGRGPQVEVTSVLWMSKTISRKAQEEDAAYTLWANFQILLLMSQSSYFPTSIHHTYGGSITNSWKWHLIRLKHIQHLL